MYLIFREYESKEVWQKIDKSSELFNSYDALEYYLEENQLFTETLGNATQNYIRNE